MRFWPALNDRRRQCPGFGGKSMAPGGVATAGHAGALPVSAPGSRAAEREAAVGQTSAMGLQKVAIDTPQLLCVVGVIETLGTISWRMAPRPIVGRFRERATPTKNPWLRRYSRAWAKASLPLITAGASPLPTVLRRQSSARRALKSLANFYRTFCPKSAARSLNGVVALSSRRAREKNSRSIRRCGLIAIMRCELFPLALTLAWRFGTSPDARKIRRPSVTENWSLRGFSA